MNVTTCANVDVEVTVDVSIEDLLAELDRRVEECGDDAKAARRAWLSQLDISTRILQRIPAEVFSSLTCEQWDLVRSRVPAQIRGLS